MWGRRNGVTGEEGHGAVVVVAETGGREGSGFGEVVGQIDAVEQGALRVTGMGGGEVEDMRETVTTAGADDEHAEAAWVGLILVLLVEAGLVLPTVHVFVGADALGAVVQFDVEGEMLV